MFEGALSTVFGSPRFCDYRLFATIAGAGLLISIWALTFCKPATKQFNLFFLLGHGRLQFLHFLMLF
jgi:hypothetical protein